VINRLASCYPRIVFNVVTAGAVALYQQLAERNVELVVAAIAGGVPEEFVVERLLDDSLVVAAGVKNPWMRRRRIDLAELVEEPWTLPPRDSFGNALITEAFRASGLEPPESAILTASRNLRERLMATGRYLSISSRYSVTPPANNPLIKALAVKLPDLRRPIMLIMPRNRTLSPLADLFIKTARAVAKTLAKKR
jgi:DNA-binding transcriptional LysR family regulator